MERQTIELTQIPVSCRSCRVFACRSEIWRLLIAKFWKRCRFKEIYVIFTTCCCACTENLTYKCRWKLRRQYLTCQPRLYTYWYLMMSGWRTFRFQMPHSSHESRRFLNRLTEVADTTWSGRAFQCLTVRWLKKCDRMLMRLRCTSSEYWGLIIKKS